MQSTSEMTPTETLIENAERQRRWLRRVCWAGVAFVVVAIMFAIGIPLRERSLLRQHGWKIGNQLEHHGLPEWVPGWAGPWFGRIDFAIYEQSSLQVSDLKMLHRFPKLHEMLLDSTDLPEPAFESLSKLSQVDSMVIRSAQVDAAGLRHLATHPKLEGLSFGLALDDKALETLATYHHLSALGLTGVTDENLRHVSRLHRLTHLDLLKSHVTDDGATWLADHCPSLKGLMIQGGPMTDVGLAELARLLDLSSLFLQDLTISDNGLAELVRFPNLRMLFLHDMTISDDGILKLKSCPTLQTIDIKNTKVTSAGVAELRKSLPTLKVSIE